MKHDLFKKFWPLYVGWPVILLGITPLLIWCYIGMKVLHLGVWLIREIEND